MAATVRIKEETHVTLRDLAREMNEPMQEVLAKAVEAYRRRRVLESSNAVYAAWRAEPQAWQEMLNERAAWDSTLLDGLEGDEWPAPGVTDDE